MLQTQALDLASGVLGAEAAAMRTNTDAFCEELEVHLHAEFFAAHERGEYRQMRKCAETLSELGSAGNGGRGVPSAMAAESVEEGGARERGEAGLISDYVDTRHKLWEFKLGHAEPEPQGPSEGSGATEDAGAEAAGVAGLARLKAAYEELRSHCEQEAAVIKRVFPQPERVVARLVRRAFDARVGPALQFLNSRELQVMHTLAVHHMPRHFSCGHAAILMAALGLCSWYGFRCRGRLTPLAPSARP